MAKLFNLARVSTSTTGTGTITLGAAVSGYLTFALAGVTDGQTVWYGIKDGANSEVGYGSYNLGSLTLTRNVISSTNSNSAISLSGSAEVFITPPSAAFSFTQRLPKTGGYTVVAGDNGALIEATSGTFTLALTAAATLGEGFWFVFRNAGTGEVTYDPNGAETIDGLTTFKAYPGEARLVMCSSTAFTTVLLEPGVATFLASGTWTKPGTGQMVLLEAWGAGGSGGKGAANAPEGGGGGGAYPPPRWIPLSSMGATETITIGAGGAAQTVASTAGNVGGNTTIGSLLTAYGGGGGGAVATGGGGGGGGGATSAGISGASGSGGAGGGPAGGAAAGASNSGAGGAAGADAGAAGGASVYGGGGGGGGIDGAGVAATNAGGASVYGGGGGGGAADSVAGGNGGTSVNGGAGSAGAIDANTSSNGTQPGGGSGGTEGGNSGAGGDGQVRITVF